MATVDHGAGTSTISMRLLDSEILVRPENTVIVLRLDAAWMPAVATSHLTRAEAGQLVEALNQALAWIRSTPRGEDGGKALPAGGDG